MFKIGYATDIHRFQKNRKLILGGEEIPFHMGLFGHSDADVVLHAIAESILGALALGDLGTYFPDTSLEYKDIDSRIILQKVVSMMKERNYHVNNLDVSISLERPKLRGYIDKMRANVAQILEVEIEQVSIKAGTNEGIGEIGKNEACLATAIVLLERGVSNG